MSEENNVFVHSSVLLDECIEGLSIRQGGIYVDGTAGGGGHSFEIAGRLTDGKLIAIDRDEAAIRAAGKRLEPYGDKVLFARNNFSEIAEVCASFGIGQIDGVLLDLGVSSYQLDTPERGFSYMADAELDMRMDRRGSLTAYDVVNTYSVAELRRILFEYGEERFAPKIASAIAAARERSPIKTTGELCEIIKSAMPAAAKNGGHHPAKRSFQAIRIEVNGELDAIEPAIRSAVSLLAPGGRIAIITFHSLEDRIVKQTFADLACGCVCPKDFPVCVCGKRPQVRLVSKKPILPSDEELERNPRSRSAKLRVAEKI
ncbi:MAG: 16S rRNA (cytosine(1402)-N(4))-methyltransferase RsmH [Clostridia bacterium]|nr:16S rRNA (cytosine(1402)-N(4))-methyltransferase RsmH [Clostridia bacterium]